MDDRWLSVNEFGKGLGGAQGDECGYVYVLPECVIELKSLRV